MIYEVVTFVNHKRVVVGRVKADVPIRAGEGLSLGTSDNVQDYKVTDVGNWCEHKQPGGLHIVTNLVLIVEPE